MPVQDPVAPRGTAPNEAPINGWKEIAAHMGKGVRTVQRWELELALPIHRLPGPRGDSVFAFASELRSWREGIDDGPREVAGHATAENVHSHRSVFTSAFRFWVLALVIGSLLTLAGIVGSRYFASWQRSRAGKDMTTGVGPVDGEVRGNALVTFDEHGTALWSHRFDDQLEPAYGDRRFMAFVDVDGDGRVETLFFAIHPTPHGSRFYCFESDGRVRFSKGLDSRHQYGREAFTAPWRGFRLLTDNATLRRGEIWITWIHAMEFPSVLQKLDAKGNVQGEFWNAGYITNLVPVIRGRQRFMLAGGTNNDWKTAFVAVIDPSRPSGRSPAVNSKYACSDCPAHAPERYILFPRLDSDREWLPAARRIEPDEDGQTMVEVVHDPALAGLYYRFDRDFNLIRIEASAEWAALHPNHRRDQVDNVPVEVAGGNGTPLVIFAVRPAVGGGGDASGDAQRR